MDYVKNKDLDERTGYYCPDKKEYLTVEELLKKAILAFNAKDYIQKRHLTTKVANQPSLL